jgi:hypothetical protein
VLPGELALLLTLSSGIVKRGRRKYTSAHAAPIFDDNSKAAVMNAVPAKSILLFSAMRMLAMTALFMLLPYINGQTNANQRDRPSPSGAKSADMRPPSIRERQFKILEMEREAAKPRTTEQEKLALAQIAEDFERMQVINNKMLGAAMAVATPDYESIAETTAEIKRRANRMKDNLRLPKGTADESDKQTKYKKPVDAVELKANLILLDGSIMSFIENPIFKNPSVVDLEKAAKANSDLETIVKLSHLISKDSQRLGKASEKP